MSAATPEPCPHGDPACPCPDGLACHYEDSGDSKGWPTPEPRELADALDPLRDPFCDCRGYRLADHQHDECTGIVVKQTVMAHLSALAADPAVLEACARAWYGNALRVTWDHEDDPAWKADRREDISRVLAAFLHAAGGQP